MRFFFFFSFPSLAYDYIPSFCFLFFFLLLPLTGLCWEHVLRSVPARAELAQTATSETSIQSVFEQKKKKLEKKEQEGDAGLGLVGTFCSCFAEGQGS